MTRIVSKNFFKRCIAVVVSIICFFNTAIYINQVYDEIVDEYRVGTKYIYGLDYNEVVGLSEEQLGKYMEAHGAEIYHISNPANNGYVCYFTETRNFRLATLGKTAADYYECIAVYIERIKDENMVEYERVGNVWIGSLDFKDVF